MQFTAQDDASHENIVKNVARLLQCSHESGPATLRVAAMCGWVLLWLLTRHSGRILCLRWLMKAAYFRLKYVNWFEICYLYFRRPLRTVQVHWLRPVCLLGTSLADSKPYEDVIRHSLLTTGVPLSLQIWLQNPSENPSSHSDISRALLRRIFWGLSSRQSSENQ